MQQLNSPPKINSLYIINNYFIARITEIVEKDPWPYKGIIYHNDFTENAQWCKFGRCAKSYSKNLIKELSYD